MQHIQIHIHININNNTINVVFSPTLNLYLSISFCNYSFQLFSSCWQVFSSFICAYRCNFNNWVWTNTKIIILAPHCLILSFLRYRDWSQTGKNHAAFFFLEIQIHFVWRFGAVEFDSGNLLEHFNCYSLRLNWIQQYFFWCWCCYKKLTKNNFARKWLQHSWIQFVLSFSFFQFLSLSLLQ